MRTPAPRPAADPVGIAATSLPRRALLTGVGRRRGIGAAIARGLAADGWDLALSFFADYDRRVHGEDSDVEDLAAELRAMGRIVVTIPGDLADPAEPPRIVDAAAADALGELGALVMCHCESVDSSILTTTVAGFDRHHAVNVCESWLLMKRLAERIDPGVSCQRACIIALTSDRTVHNLPYGATKGALDRLVLAGTHELADRGIRTNVINPGPIDTGWMDDEARSAASAQTPGGVLGEPTTVADLVRFLVSDRGAWIRGQLLLSNGGFATPAV